MGNGLLGKLNILWIFYSLFLILLNAIIPRAKEREKPAEETEATFENQATQAARGPSGTNPLQKDPRDHAHGVGGNPSTAF